MRAFALVSAVFVGNAAAATVSFFSQAACQSYSTQDFDASFNCESGCQNLKTGEASIMATLDEPNMRLVVYDGADCRGNSQTAAQCCGATAITSGTGTACMTPPDNFAGPWLSYQIERIEGIAGGGEACPCKQPGCPDNVPTS